MPIQNVILNTSNGVNNPEDSLVLVRSEVLYYLKFINYDKDLFASGSKLTSKPTITVYTDNSQKKVIIDYTLANETDKKYIKSFFANMTQIDTFSVSQGDYIDVSEVKADVSCSLTYVDYKEDKIFALVNSITNENTAIEVYAGDYFTQTPQLSKSGSLGNSIQTENYSLILLNPNTNNNFNYMGITVGDVIETIYENSKNHGVKYEVEDIINVNQKQTLKLKKYNNYGLPLEESLLGKPVILNVYVTNVNKDKQLPLINNAVTGCCYNLVDSIKLENQTEYQCKSRQRQYTFTTSNCNEISDLVVSELEDIYDVTMQQVLYSITKFETVAGLCAGSTSIRNASYDKYAVDIQPTNYRNTKITNKLINLSPDKTYAFSQTNDTNKNNLLLFSTSNTAYVPYTIGVYGNISKDRIGSVQYLQTAKDTPQLFLFIENQTSWTGYQLLTNPELTGISLAISPG